MNAMTACYLEHRKQHLAGSPWPLRQLKQITALTTDSHNIFDMIIEQVRDYL